MIFVRRSKERGHADHGWLKTYHSFSFADYYDKNFMGFSCLRVINQDIIAGGAGFPTHGHRDMEIVTYILRGQLQHKDSMGTSSVIRPGELQRMSAGTGVQHSEFNASRDQDCELLQIWIEPQQRGLTPSYEQKEFTFSKSGFLLVAAPENDPSSEVSEAPLKIHQDVKIYAVHDLTGSQRLPLSENRAGWLQMITGKLKMGDIEAGPGDALAILQEETPLVENVTGEPIHFLMFDLPAFDS